MSTAEWVRLNKEMLREHRDRRRELERSEPSAERTRLLALIDERIAAIEAEIERGA